MKVGIKKMGPMSKIYGEEYNEAFFQNLWIENLTDKKSDIEIVWIENDAMKNIDAVAKDLDGLIGIWITDGLISDELLTQHPRLKYLATTAHGFGKIDKEICKKHHATVTNTVYGDVTIAQYAMALLLEICHNIGGNDAYYKHQKWMQNNTERSFAVVTRQIELYQKTFGIIGLGNIGFWAAKMAAGFGMHVIAYSRTKKIGKEYDFIEQVGIEELYERSDVISIHCPLTEKTEKMIDASSFQKMKDGVILINTARGAIIDEPALVDALKRRKVYAAGLDVLSGEPLKEPCELMYCKNTKITEHIAWLPVESRIRSIQLASQNFINWKEGHPTSVVSN